MKILRKVLAVFTALVLTACGAEITEEAVSTDNERGERPQTATTAVETAAVTTTAEAEEAIAAELEVKEITDEKPSQRDYYITPNGGGDDTVTLMFYLCGSDLESYSGAATADLIEISEAYADNPNFNIIVETGGSTAWAYDVIPADTNTYWKLEDGDLTFLEDAGLKDMTDPETVTDFIEFSTENYPADRYFFIMWDHGGGTTGGVMYDENFYDSKCMMITELDDALENAGVKFDFFGFDCCLMGTVETAFMVEKHADYMAASQRTEPGTGWYYTDFIAAIDENTSIPTADLGAILVDTYFKKTPYINELEGSLTLSFLDLSYLDAMFWEMDNFFAAADETLLTDSGFINVAQTLSANKSINDDSQADLLTLIDSMGGSEALQAELDNVIVHSDALIPGYTGLSLFFPYSDLSLVSDALYIYEKIGISDTYQGFIKTAANIMAGGRVYSGGGTETPHGEETEDYSEYDWYDNSYSEEYDEFYSETNFDYEEIPLEEFDGYYYVSLTEEDRELITDYLLWAYYDDGEGYVELGADALYEFDEYGDLIVGYDYSWVALDGEIVPFYSIENVTSDGGSFLYNYGYVPCEVNGEDAELILLWNEEHPSGTVAGWRYDTYGEASMKGLFALEDGLEIDFYYYYYPYDSYDYELYYLGDTVVVDGEMTVSYEYINEILDGEIEIYYSLTDIYQNTYFTESLYF
ncbi:MAG: hypothetical protein LBL98_01755 [Ruminococcus sp.]|jgi:hypothetical protein|nr:hypothetical protein [Ruminococcus sp.]